MRRLFLHGFTGSRESWSDIAAEGDLVIDLPGHDGNVPTARSWNDACVQILGHLPADEVFHIIGYSLGGRIALDLLRSAPERFARASLIGARQALTSDHERAARRDHDEQWAQMLEREGIEAFSVAWERQDLLQPVPTAAPEAIARAHRIRRNHAVAGLAWSLRTMGLGAMPGAGSSTASSDVSRIPVPTELIVGERDSRFRQLVRPLQALFVNATYMLAPRAGHNVLIDAPAFLRKHLKPSGVVP